jgi:hypothetical protein
MRGLQKAYLEMLVEWDMIPQGGTSIHQGCSFFCFEIGRAIPSSRERFDVVVLAKITYRWNASRTSLSLFIKGHVRTNRVLEKEMYFVWQIPSSSKPYS